MISASVRLLAAACAFVALSLGGSVQAQSEPVGRQPYDLHLVVLLSDHRFLSTEAFHNHFPRDLVQQTKLALGNLAHVDAAMSHPLGDAIRRDGLGSLDTYEEVSSRRTWFFTLRFHEGQFHLTGRFFDGLTGMAGAAARTVSTSDRTRLAPLAARMIADEFPLVGSVTAVKGDSVELTLHGGLLGDSVHVPQGAAFAVSRIAPEAGKLHARRLNWAVLEAKGPPAAGVLACRFWHRYSEDKIASGNGAGFRALMLPTRTAPLTLQVIDQESSQPLAGIGVKVAGGVKHELNLVTDASGLVVTPEKVNGLAIVTLTQGGRALAQFPAPMIDDKRLVCAVSADTKGENRAGLDIRRQQLRVRVLSTLQVVDHRFSELRVLLEQSLEKSLDHAKQTLAFLDGEIADIRGERDELVQLEKQALGMVEDDGEKGIARLLQFRGVVEQTLNSVTQAIENRDRQTERHNQGAKIVAQAAILEGQAKFDDAIALYQKAAKLLPPESKIGDKLAALQAGWAIKNQDHEQARQFLVKRWPTIETGVLREHLAMAEKSLEICRAVDDRLAPRCFLTANIDHFANIAKITGKLKQSRSADDRKRLEAWTGVFDTLRRLSQQANEQIAEKKTPPKQS